MRASRRAEAPRPAEVAAADPPASVAAAAMWHLSAEPWHSFEEATAAPLPEAGKVSVRFALLPTAWRLAPGSRLGLVVATGDPQHFAPNPAAAAQPEGPPPPVLLLGESLLWLPLDGGEAAPWAPST